jgi:tetratricopeptide (TPR) repeat protein
MLFRSARVFRAWLIIAALFHVVATCEAQTIQQQKTCENYAADALARISACSALIKAQRYADGKPIPVKTLAWQYVCRAIAYDQISDYERALADYKQALPLFPNGQTNIDFVQLKQQWVRYLQEIQDDDDFLNWAGPPSDGYWKSK